MYLLIDNFDESSHNEIKSLAIPYSGIPHSVSLKYILDNFLYLRILVEFLFLKCPWQIDFDLFKVWIWE